MSHEYEEDEKEWTVTITGTMHVFDTSKEGAENWVIQELWDARQSNIVAYLNIEAEQGGD